MNTSKLNFWLDVVLGAVFILALLSGLMTHSIQGRMELHIFVSLSLSIGIVAHLILHRKWLTAASRSGERSRQMKVNIWLNRLLGISWLWALLSGVHNHLDPINGAPMHVLAAASMTCILSIHLAGRWKWVMVTARRYRGNLRFD